MDIEEKIRKRREYQRDYALRNPEKVKAWAIKKRDNYEFGGNKQLVLERDGNKCVKCGMTNEEHLRIWNKRITVDHIDGSGTKTHAKKRNNDLSNLQTLCLRCHGKKDIKLDKATRKGLKNNEKWRKANQEYLQRRWGHT